eukprot:UN02710
MSTDYNHNRNNNNNNNGQDEIIEQQENTIANTIINISQTTQSYWDKFQHFRHRNVSLQIQQRTPHDYAIQIKVRRYILAAIAVNIVLLCLICATILILFSPQRQIDDFMVCPSSELQNLWIPLILGGISMIIILSYGAMFLYFKRQLVDPFSINNTLQNYGDVIIVDHSKGRINNNSDLNINNNNNNQYNHKVATSQYYNEFKR